MKLRLALMLSASSINWSQRGSWLPTTMRVDVTRLRQLRVDDWCVAGEAALLAGIAALAVRSVGVERAARALSRRAGVNQVRRVSIDRVTRVTEAVTAKLGARCL